MENNPELNDSIIEFDKNKAIKKDKYNSLEILRKRFVEDFSEDKLKVLDINHYIEGRRQEGKINKNTFCYRIEIETIGLGIIHAVAGVRNFGVWMDVETQKYVWQKGFEKQGIKNYDDAFKFIKEQILSTIQYGKEKNIEKLKEITLSPMFKGKILFMYLPKDYINIFDDNWINYYLEKLEINEYSEKDILEKRELLLDYKNNNKIMKNWSNIEFADFLYLTFGKPNKEEFEIFSELKNVKEQEEILKVIKEKPLHQIINELKNIKPKEGGYVYYSGKSYKRYNDTIAKIKILRGMKCQICNNFILKKDGGKYIEAAHIIPKHKNGSELPENILILCPNHHKEFDFGDRKIIKRNSEELIFQLNNQEYRLSLKLDL